MKMEKTYQSERMTFEDSDSLQHSFQPRVGTHKLTVLCGSVLSGRSKMTKVFYRSLRGNFLTLLPCLWQVKL